MLEEMRQPPFILTSDMRIVVEESAIHLCFRRGWTMKAVNARSNHAHAVISAPRKPERIVDALKAGATKALREGGLVGQDVKIWSRGRSRRYLWKPRHVHAAIEYTLYGQGDFVLPD